MMRDVQLHKVLLFAYCVLAVDLATNQTEGCEVISHMV